ASIDARLSLLFQRLPSREIVVPIDGEVQPGLERGGGGVYVRSPQCKPRLETQGVTGTQTTGHGSGGEDPVQHLLGLVSLDAQLASRLTGVPGPGSSQVPRLEGPEPSRTVPEHRLEQ